MSQRLKNPYGEPGGYENATSSLGRVRESTDLFHLLIARRIVVLYGPSGAGKTSLVRTTLIQRLQQEGFFVAPIINVTPKSSNHFNKGSNKEVFTNAWISNTFNALEATRLPDNRLTMSKMARLDVDEYLVSLEKDLAVSELVLIFDHLETLFLDDFTNDGFKETFFRQIGIALERPNRWALFVIDEKFIAALEVYAYNFKGRLRDRYKMGFLSINSAINVFCRPVEQLGKVFDISTATSIVTDVAKISTRLFRYIGYFVPQLEVDPDFLLIMCQSIWDVISGHKSQWITINDPQGIGTVEFNLLHYYNQAITEISKATKINIHVINNWVDLTSSETRFPFSSSQVQSISATTYRKLATYIKKKDYPRTSNSPYARQRNQLKVLQKVRSVTRQLKTPQVFLCYAQEDRETVIEISYKLWSLGITPWLDKVDLLPGQQWQERIKEAIQKSDFFLVFLSRSSTSKRGYIHKEISFAIDLLDEFPKGRTFVIPVLLEECAIPSNLRGFHYCDYTNEKSLENLLRVITEEDVGYRILEKPQTYVEIFNQLENLLPGEFHGTAKVIAEQITNVLSGLVSVNEAQIEITKEPNKLDVLKMLAGQQINLPRKVVTFGNNNQIGDIAIGNIAGGDIINNLTINIMLSPFRSRENI